MSGDKIVSVFPHLPSHKYTWVVSMRASFLECELLKTPL